MKLRVAGLLTVLTSTFALSAFLGPGLRAENPWVEQARNRETPHQTSQQSQQGMFPQPKNNASWQEQQVRNREMQSQALQQQAQQGYSPQVSQGQRWEDEWRQQHPGQPMPNFGQLEKMHRGEITANMNAGFDRMRQARQAELQRNHNWARDLQMKQNAEQHVTWSPAQWRQWDQRYDNEQKQNAQDYLNNIARERERMDEEWRRTGKNPYTQE